MNFKLHVRVCLIVALYILISFRPGFSSNEGINTLSKHLNIAVYEDALSLDQSIRCIAVDSNGNVAIRSGSTNDKCDYIISVYSKSGAFLYGYEVILKNQRGYGLLFFDSQDNLCYSVTYSSAESPTQKALVMFEPNSSQYSYSVYDPNTEIFDGEIQYINNIPVFVSSQSQYSTAYCTEYCFALRDDLTSQTYMAYNQLQAHTLTAKRQNLLNILVVVFSATFIILLGAFLSWCDRNRQAHL